MAVVERAAIPSVEITFRTDPGRDPDKQVNEDSAAHAETPLGLLAIVCDGMGGHAGGKEASELAVQTIIACVKSADPGANPRETLRAAIEEANARIWSMTTAETGLRPGSTVVALLVHEAGAEVAHVGDSRIYHVHAGAISQVTRDHSLVQEMVDRNIIRAEDAATHPEANKILRALGIAKEVEVDVRPEPLPYVAADVFILCSDGLSDLVSPSEILQTAGTQPPAQAAGQLVDFANARGGHDNVTAMVLRMKASAVASAAPTIVKTVPVTQHVPEARAAEAGAGPRGTVVTAPALGAGAAGPPGAVAPGTGPQIPVGLSAPAHIPPAPSPRAGTTTPPSRSRLPVVLGIVLALTALAIAGVLVWVERRPHHVSVPLVEPEGGAPAPIVHEEPAAAPSEITPSPPLPASAGPEPAICARARSARARGTPPSIVQKLENQCRAAGGAP